MRTRPGVRPRRDAAPGGQSSAALADALRRRGAGDPAAGPTAEVAVFRTAFGRWLGATDHRDFPQLVREARHQLKALAAA
jgi:hypothetical protein